MRDDIMKAAKDGVLKFLAETKDTAFQGAKVVDADRDGFNVVCSNGTTFNVPVYEL